MRLRNQDEHHQEARRSSEAKVVELDRHADHANKEVRGGRSMIGTSGKTASKRTSRMFAKVECVRQDRHSRAACFDCYFFAGLTVLRVCSRFAQNRVRASRSSLGSLTNLSGFRISARAGSKDQRLKASMASV